MARYIAILANGGKRIDVSVVDRVLNKDGTEVNKEEVKKYVNGRLGLKEAKEEDLKIKKKNVDVILEGMRSVTTETGGTAYAIFQDFDIEVGGKTGSAEARRKSKCMVCRICTI